MSDFYWELVQYDGTVTYIPPDSIDVVKKRMDNRDPVHTSTGSIPTSQIKFFRPTEKKYTDQQLIEAASVAFDEAIENEDGSIACRWVKKSVTQQMFNKYYSASPGYKRLDEFNGMITVAMLLPIHQIDTRTLDYCSEDDIKRLTK